MEYKALRDFAQERGVSIRTLQAHVKSHEGELEGHILRYGPPRGTFIDEYAQELIGGLLIGHPIATADPGLLAEIDRLKNELEEAQKKVIVLLQDKAELTERALTAERQIGLAEASARVTEEKVQRLEIDLREAQVRADQAEDKVQALKRRTLWQRITRQGES